MTEQTSKLVDAIARAYVLAPCNGRVEDLLLDALRCALYGYAREATQQGACEDDVEAAVDRRVQEVVDRAVDRHLAEQRGAAPAGEVSRG